jgi:hypothetical protein
MAGAMAPALATTQFRRRFGREQETHAFPPPVRNAATRTGATRTDRGQRPTRRARSARRWRGGRWPGALGPRLARDQPGAVAGAMAPAIAAVKGLSLVRAGAGNALRFPARAGRCHEDHLHPHQQRPAPDPAGEKRPPGAGRALAGGFGPPAGVRAAWPYGRGDGPCLGNDAVPPPLRAGTGNACVSPARAERCHQDRCRPHRQRPAPDPAGEKRPPVAGRALAGGFGPPAGQGSAWRCGRGDGPCHWSGERAFVGAGGIRKRTAFPRPCGTVPRRPAGPGTPASQRPTRRVRSARQGRGGRWPRALGPRRAWGQRGAVAGAMAPAIAAAKVRSLVRAG